MKKAIKVCLKDGTPINVYGSAKEAAQAYGVTPNTIIYWVYRNIVKDGYIFMFDNPGHAEPNPHIGGSQIKNRPDVDLSNTEYSTIRYETKFKRICITPCPYFDERKVGSVLCQGCNSFKGINRTNQMVACSKSPKKS